MKRSIACAAALLSSVFTVEAGDSGTPGFIRVHEDESRARLQTGVTRYEKGGAAVDLVGAIHIADRKYYESLNVRLDGYEAVLFEMIGGDRIPDTPVRAEGEGEPMSELHQVYDTVSRFLNLTGQSSVIDYRKGNFVHADLTHAEFEELQAERGESIMSFAMEAQEQADGDARRPDAKKLLTAMLAGRSDLVKLEIIHTLGSGDDQIGGLSGESVIITDRNRRCIEVLDRELTAGRKRLAIFYGAAHFPDMEKRLLEMGFKRVRHEWVTAWDVPKGKALPPEEKDAA